MMSTEKARSGRGVYLRWLNMLLLSLNTVLLVIPVVSVRMKYPVLMIGQRIFYFLFARGLFPVPETSPNRAPGLDVLGVL